jgi:tetratricopeptide (TPR) repeat protein
VRSTSLPLLAVACSLVAWLGSAAEPPKTTKPSKSIGEFVTDLSDPNFRNRETATRELWKLGEKARPALEQVLKDGTPEAADRAEGILAKFDWGITPDTPKDVLAQIQLFRDGKLSDREAVLLKLADGGSAGHLALRSLLSKEVPDPPEAPPGYARRQLFAAVGKTIAARVPLLLMDGKTDEAESLLAMNLLGPSEEHARDYVLFMAARGKAVAAVTRLTDLLTERPTDPNLRLALVYACRTTGEAQKAKRVMKELAEDDPQLAERYDNLLVDLNEWGELIDRPARNPNSAEGLKAFRLRLAGKGQEADAVLKKLADADTSNARGFGVDPAAVGLFLNGRTAEGLTRLKETESAPHIAADIHTARLDFAAALDLIKAGLAEDHGNVDDGDDARTRKSLRTLYKLKRARLLAQLGERDAAAQLFAELEDVADRSDRGVQTELVRTALRSGFADIAAGFLGRMQARWDETGDGLTTTVYDPFEVLFAADADAARFWWKVVRFSNPKGDPAEQMRTVRDLLRGKLKSAEVAGWFKTAADYAAKSEHADHMTPASGDSVCQALALAAAHRANGDTKSAVAVLAAFADRGEHKRTDSSRAWIFGLDETFRLWVDLGDWLGELGRHDEAAKRLEQGWRLHPNNPVLLYLSGQALVAAGQEKEGRRRMELAHVVPLGNPQLRGRFLEELINRGEKADMRVEMARISECAWGVDSSTSGNVWNQVGRAAVVLHEYAAAVAAHRKSTHFVLKTWNIVYVEGFAYANVPALVRGLEGRAQVAAGQTTAGVTAAEEALAMLPTHVETLQGMVHLLDKKGETAAADKLFASAWDRYATAIKAHPKSAWLKYQAAWLAVGCRREKETALNYAAEAVSDDAEHRGYREALAEAHFRNGDRSRALEVMTKLAADDRRNWHSKWQLARYKSAAFDSPLPFQDE